MISVVVLILVFGLVSVLLALLGICVLVLMEGAATETHDAPRSLNTNITCPGMPNPFVTAQRKRWRRDR